MVAVAAGATAVGSRGCAHRPATRARGSTDTAPDYVDRDGWMLTAAEGEEVRAPGGAARHREARPRVVGRRCRIALLSSTSGTLAPGLTADVDTAMFQFVGRVLGVAHNPGYPLYVLLTHAFSYVPVGSLAYRINLFSALLGALTVGLAFLIARRLGCRRVIAAAAALGLAFWRRLLVAGGHRGGLHAEHRDRRRRAAVAADLEPDARARAGISSPWRSFAAGLGNHTTIVGFGPGIAIFALLTDARFVLRPRTLVVTAGTLVGGLLQYGFILWRSSQPDAYVESRATSLKELVRRHARRPVPGTAVCLRLARAVQRTLPWVLQNVLVPELTIVGVALALAGAGWLLWRRRDQAALLLTGAVVVVAFAFNYAVNRHARLPRPDHTRPLAVAAVGGERIVAAWREDAVPGGRGVLCAAGLDLATNYREDDRSRDSGADVQLDRLLEALPEPAGSSRKTLSSIGW